MKNIIQSILPSSRKELIKKLFSLCGILLLLFIFIVSFGKNKSSKKVKQEKKTCESKLTARATPQITPVSANAFTSNQKAKEILFKSTDDGTTWQNLSAGLPQDVNIMKLFKQGNEVFAGTGDGTIYHCTDLQTGVWTKENVGGFFEKEPITGIFRGRSGPYVSVYRHGFFKRIPGTGFWQPIGNAPKDVIVHDVLETADGTMYVAGGPGIYKSTDEGITWKHVFTTGWVTSLSAANGVIIAAGMPGLLRSTDGEHWECMLRDEAAMYKTNVIDGGFVATRLSAPWPASMDDTPWNTSSGDIRLRTSTDGGKTWQLMNGRGLPPQLIYDFEQVGKYLFTTHNSGISRSADGGKTWELIRDNDITDPNKNTRIELIHSEDAIYAVVVKGGC